MKLFTTKALAIPAIIMATASISHASDVTNEADEATTKPSAASNVDIGREIGNVIMDEVVDDKFKGGISDIIDGVADLNTTDVEKKNDAIIGITTASVNIAKKVVDGIEEAFADDSDDEGQKHGEKDGFFENVGEVVSGIFKHHKEDEDKDTLAEKFGRKVDHGIDKILHHKTDDEEKK